MKKKFVRIICGVLLFLILAFLIFYRFYFLRQPVRNIPNDDNLFVSPANGKIIAIIHQDDLTDNNSELYKNNNIVIDDWTEGFSGATLISIMMTPLDVHFQKAPLSATLIGQDYQEGYFYNAMKSKDGMRSTFQNEYNSMLFETEEGYKFRIIQIAGFLARRIVPYLEVKDHVIQGEHIGHIRFGSQVSIILDNNFEIKANVGDKVIDGETVLAVKKN